MIQVSDKLLKHELESVKRSSLLPLLWCPCGIISVSCTRGIIFEYHFYKKKLLNTDRILRDISNENYYFGTKKKKKTRSFSVFNTQDITFSAIQFFPLCEKNNHGYLSGVFLSSWRELTTPEQTRVPCN